MLKQMKKKLKQEKGFTLVELLAVIAILGIIVAIAVPTIGNIISDSEQKAATANIELIESAARLANASDTDPNGKVTVDGTSYDAYSVDFLQDEGFLESDDDLAGSVYIDDNSNFIYTEATTS